MRIDLPNNRAAAADLIRQTLATFVVGVSAAPGVVVVDIPGLLNRSQLEAVMGLELAGSQETYRLSEILAPSGGSIPAGHMRLIFKAN